MDENLDRAEQAFSLNRSELAIVSAMISGAFDDEAEAYKHLGILLDMTTEQVRTIEDDLLRRMHARIYMDYPARMAQNERPA